MKFIALLLVPCRPCVTEIKEPSDTFLSFQQQPALAYDYEVGTTRRRDGAEAVCP